MEGVYRLWDDLHRFPTGKTDEALNHFASSMATHFQADSIRWLAAIRVFKGAHARSDKLLGWRARAIYSLIPDPKSYDDLIP